MKKSRLTLLATTALIAALTAGCGSNDATNNATDSKDKATTQEEKVVQDQLGRDVKIPTKVDRIVTGGILPFYSTWYVATDSTKEIVGMHPNSYSAAKNSILAKISPDVLKADTSFVKNGEVNVEELMKIDPQIYFEGTADEKTIKKVETTGIPVMGIKAIDAVKNTEPMGTFNSWLKVISDITGTTERTDRFLDEGKKVQNELNEKLSKVKESEKPCAMVLFNHSKDSIVVAGNNFFGNQWLNATGAKDVAQKDIVGTKEVNMEQIYKWNPDVIYITDFTATQPEDLLKNKIAGQDWSQVKAVQEGKVYKTPVGIYRWFPPNGDAPLMLKWMAQKNYPDLFTYDMKTEIKNYYKDFYSYDVSDDEAEKILHPSSDSALQ